MYIYIEVETSYLEAHWKLWFLALISRALEWRLSSEDIYILGLATCPQTKRSKGEKLEKHFIYCS